jgi:hypothetical protein
MNTRPLSDFLSRMLVHVPACTEPLAIQALLDSAIEFCEKSLALRQYIDPITTVAGVDRYYIEKPARTTDVLFVSKVFLGDELLHPSLALDAISPEQGRSAPSGYYTVSGPDGYQLVFAPIPDGVYTVKIEAILAPTRNATVVDSYLFDKWLEPIVYGALARVMSVGGQPFSNQSMAMMYVDRTARLTHNARVNSNFGRVVGSTSVKTRPFA